MRMSRAALRSRDVGMLIGMVFKSERSNIDRQILQSRAAGRSNGGEDGIGAVVKTRESSSCWSD